MGLKIKFVKGEKINLEGVVHLSNDSNEEANYCPVSTIVYSFKKDEKKVIEEVDRGWDLELGIVTGYSGMDVAPMIRYINDGWWVAPAYEQSHGGNVGVTIGYEFKLGD